MRHVCVGKNLGGPVVRLASRCCKAVSVALSSRAATVPAIHSVAASWRAARPMTREPSGCSLRSTISEGAFMPQTNPAHDKAFKM